MVNSRLYVPLTRDSVELRLRARLYPAQGVKARPVLISARQRDSSEGRQRYPFVENYLDGSFQQHVHNCQVVVVGGAEERTFMVFFKRHRSFNSNSSIIALVHPSTISSVAVCSDVVVMRVGVKGQYINMRNDDGHIADLLMVRFAKDPAHRGARAPHSLVYNI